VLAKGIKLGHGTELGPTLCYCPPQAAGAALVVLGFVTINLAPEGAAANGAGGANGGGARGGVARGGRVGWLHRWWCCCGACAEGGGCARLLGAPLLPVGPKEPAAREEEEVGTGVGAFGGTGAVGVGRRRQDGGA